MSEMARWSTATTSASSTVLWQGCGDSELELWLYLGFNGDARGSVRWSEAWRSYVSELLKNGTVAVVHKLSGNGTMRCGFARAWRG